MHLYLSENPEYFDPETIDIMVRALDEAWKRFQASAGQAGGQPAAAARTALAPGYRRRLCGE